MIKDNQVYLKHIIDAINHIKDFIKNLDFNGFLNSHLYQSAVVRELEVIGEATKNLTEDFCKKYPNISWKDIAGMRDKLIHGYMGVNLEDVWKTAKEDIIDLENQITKIIKKYNSSC